MEARSALLLGLLSIFGIVQASDVPTESPAFCGDNDCPKYQLVNKYDNFEQRQYEETRWVVTPLEEDIFGLEIVTGFRRLFKYINGTNAEGLQIKMTVPVVIHVPLTQPTNATSYMAFFVPHEVKDPPKPTNPAVYLETHPPFSAYVKTFGGYALGFTYAREAKVLAEELRTLGLQFDDSHFLRAGYNDPFTFFNRHNEVWYVAK